MKKILFFIFIVTSLFSKERIFVVERSDSSLAVIEDHKFIDRIDELHNFNHAVVKFYKNDGYVITRDGYIIKFDPKTNKKSKEVKSSKSAIGFTIDKDFVAVANYDNQTVEILDRDLNSIQSIKTSSKNVGIKIYKDYLVFALMDKDELWVMKNDSNTSTPNFTLTKKIEDAGVVPFDAMITDEFYIVGFFKSSHFGVLDLKNLEYKKIELNLENQEPVLKVPHFGFWSISGDKIFIPAVGDKKVFVFNKEFKFIKSISTSGLPVFTSISPDETKIAVTYSGKDFPIIEILDTTKLEVIKTIKHTGKILHVRWSKEEPILYVSNNTDSKVIGYDTKNWNKTFEVDVKNPSGIFIFEDIK